MKKKYLCPTNCLPDKDRWTTTEEDNRLGLTWLSLRYGAQGDGGLLHHVGRVEKYGWMERERWITEEEWNRMVGT
jgi:hypothetical protein